MIPTSFMPVISKTAQDRLGYNGAPIGNDMCCIEWSMASRDPERSKS